MDKAICAATEGLLEELQEIAKTNPPALDESDDIGLNPIHWAARYGHTECVELLCANNISASRRSLQRLCPMHYAAQGAHIEVMRVLLKNKANVNESDHDSWTPLHHAAYFNQPRAIEFLLANGADIGAKNQLFCTPLHVACQAVALEAIALLILRGAQYEYAPPLLKPVAMMPLPPPPTDFDDGPTMEQSNLGAEFRGLLESGQYSDVVVSAADGTTLNAHRCVLAVRCPMLLEASPVEASGEELRVLFEFLYTGMVGTELMTGSQCSCEKLASDMQKCVALIGLCKRIGLVPIARLVQRSIVSRIGRGGPAKEDGFNADLELLARVSPFASVFDPDFRLLLGFFVHSNFSPLMQYYTDRVNAVGNFGIEREDFVRALVMILPEAKPKVAVPSRWKHWNVPPMSRELKTGMTGVVNQIKGDKLAGWFMYAVSAIDYSDPKNTKSSIADYWAVCPYPMHLEAISARLEADYYVSPEEVISDLRLVFCNAMRYNDESSELWEHAVALYYLTREFSRNKLSNVDLSEFPAPYIVGNVGHWIDLELPYVAERYKKAFQYGKAPSATDLSVDPTSTSGVPVQKKKKGKSASAAAKRGRKDLKESDYTPQSDMQEPTPPPRRKSSAAPKAAAKKNKAAPAPSYEYEASYPPPPELPSEGWSYSFQDKTRLGDDIQRLREDQLEGLIVILQRKGREVMGPEMGEEEVELDINKMTNETFAEVRRYVDSCLQ